MIYNTIDHKIKTIRLNQYDRVSESFFSMRWYDYENDDVKWEPRGHLPGGTILSYYQRKKLSISDSTDQAGDG